MRLDKYLSNLEVLTRKQSRKLIKRGWFFVNNVEVFDSSHEVNEWDVITLDWIEHEVCRNVTIRLWKPVWYVSSNSYEWGHPSYKELLEDCPYAPLVHVAWRLDFDTEWLLILTSDWQLNHQIISPKYECKKRYLVTCKKQLEKKECRWLEKWVILDDWYKTLPAVCTLVDPDSYGKSDTITLTLTEWKFHQVKRMLEAINNKVIHLKRETVGERNLEWLKCWKWDYI